MTTSINTKVLLEIVEGYIKQGSKVQIVRDDLQTDILVPEVSVKGDHINLSIELELGEYTVIFAVVYVNGVVLFSQRCEQKTTPNIDNFLVMPIYIS